MNVHASIWTEEKGFKANRDYKTDALGIAQVQLPKSYTIVRLWACKRPFVEAFAHWEENDIASGKGLPEQHTFRLRPGVSIGGRILDDQGKPIAGVKVDISGTPTRRRRDAEGRWHVDCASGSPKATFNIRVFHPDYVSDEYGGELQRDAGITTAMLRNKTATLTMKRGIIVRGRVTDPASRPIKDALVVRGDDPYMLSTGSGVPCVFPTDADGRFRLPAMPPGQRVLTVIAPGWAPQLHRVNLRADMAA